jgi:hypothetical protein
MSTKKTSLVIITCLKDKWKFEMLCRSMSVFLEPCDVVIVYNEMQKKMPEWLDWFEVIRTKFLKKFNIKTYSVADFYPKKYIDKPYTDPVHASGGWVKQQVLKLLVAQKVNTPEYVIFDSKNFFTRPGSLQDIEKTIPHGHWTLAGVTEWTKICCEKLELIYPGHQLKLRSNTTPYFFKTNVARRLVKKLGGNDEFIQWFSKTALLPKVSPAEFILYELFEMKSDQRDIGTTLANNATVWMHHIHGQAMTPESLGLWIKGNPNFVAGLHGGVNTLLSLTDVKQILEICGISFILPQYSSSPF